MTKQTTAFTAISRTAISALLLCAVGIAATGCHPRPEITASSREEAMEKCLDDIDRELTVIKKERARAKADPESASFKTNENYYSDYQYTFLLDDEYDTIEITQAFCKPSRNRYHKDLWHNTGYVEYLERPTEKAFNGRTKVEVVIVSYGYTWKEQPR